MVRTGVSEQDAEQEHASSWSPGRVLTVIGVLAMIVFWAWIFAGGPAKPNPDRLDDRAFVARTEDRCRDLRRNLRALPNPIDAPTAAARAEVLDDANAQVERFVDAVEADSPESSDDAKRMEGWIRDWRTYVRDREDYAKRLRRDAGARFYVSENKAFGDTVDKTIEIFADDANDMPVCATPGDVG